MDVMRARLPRERKEKKASARERNITKQTSNAQPPTSNVECTQRAEVRGREYLRISSFLRPSPAAP